MSGEAPFDLYKLLVEEVREARRARRELSNVYLTLNLAGVGGLGFLAKGEAASLRDPLLMLWIVIALWITCWMWRTSNAYYTRLLGAKYEVIYDIEAKLPAQPIRTEWEKLRAFKPKRSFSLEYAMPALFAFGYLVFLSYQVNLANLPALAEAALAPIQQFIHR